MYSAPSFRNDQHGEGDISVMSHTLIIVGSTRSAKVEAARAAIAEIARVWT
jgi:hypothetical protein